MHFSPESSLTIWPCCTYGNKVKNVPSQTHINTSSSSYDNCLLNYASNLFLKPTNIFFRKREASKREILNGEFVNPHQIRRSTDCLSLVCFLLQNSAFISLNLKLKMSFRLKIWKFMLGEGIFSIGKIIFSDYISLNILISQWTIGLYEKGCPFLFFLGRYKIWNILNLHSFSL